MVKLVHKRINRIGEVTSAPSRVDKIVKMKGGNPVGPKSGQALAPTPLFQLFEIELLILI